MYCPKCSHQVVSNNVRYCPGCGLWLHGVAEMVANNGVFAAGEESSPKPRRSRLKRGALLGATLFYLVSLLFILVVARNPFRGEPALVLTVNLIIWLAVMAMIGASGYLKRLITKIFNIFSEEESSPLKKSASPRGPSLPAAYSAPVADSGRQFVDTAKVAQPSSVTEQTTSRLNNI
jgi:hypothetical protein